MVLNHKKSMILIQAVQRSNSMSARVYLIKTNKNISIKKKRGTRQRTTPNPDSDRSSISFSLILYYIL